MSLRDKCIEKLWFYCGGDSAEAFNVVLDILTEHATPMFRMGGLAPAWYLDNDPDEDTTWVIDLAALASEEDTE